MIWPKCDFLMDLSSEPAAFVILHLRCLPARPQLTLYSPSLLATPALSFWPRLLPWALDSLVYLLTKQDKNAHFTGCLDLAFCMTCLVFPCLNVIFLNFPFSVGSVRDSHLIWRCIWWYIKNHHKKNKVNIVRKLCIDFILLHQNKFF